MIKLLDREERIRAELVALFRAYGYDRYRMAQFETYEVYRKNKDYVDGGSIVTFTDPQGNLLALRPDVTLSIVNNLPGEVGTRKYFYDENVFRRENGCYREIRQIGIEYIGGEGSYPECEAVMLALESLALVGEKHVLVLGDMDVAEALIQPLDLTEPDRILALGYIKAKAFHELKRLVEGRGAAAETLLRVLALEGDPREVLSALASEPLVPSSAITELETLVKTVETVSAAARVKLDMSLIDDYRYYNGAIFCGYVEGEAQAIISGGRYDRMLRRMGKSARAIGFALNASSVVGKHESDKCEIINSGKMTAPELCAAVRALVKSGSRVRAEWTSKENDND